MKDSSGEPSRPGGAESHARWVRISHWIITLSVLTLVFSEIFRFEAESYPVYALSGIVFWNFFSQSLTASMNSLRGNAALVTKLPVPKAVCAGMCSRILPAGTSGGSSFTAGSSTSRGSQTKRLPTSIGLASAR